MRARLEAWRLLALGTLFLGGAGCGDDFAPSAPAERPTPYPEATTQDLLVDNLTRAYNEGSTDEYDKLLHEGFVFYFAPDEVAEIGMGVSWDRAQDVASARRMFTAQPGHAPDGNPVAPVQKLQLTLVPEDDGAGWTDQVSQDFAGTTMRRFEVDMRVTYTSGNSERITGLQEFYAAPKTVMAKDGSAVTVYRLKYWRDLGKALTKASLASDQTSWGLLKSLFTD
jgi:hypothetical protein